MAVRIFIRPTVLPPTSNNWYKNRTNKIMILQTSSKMCWKIKTFLYSVKNNGYFKWEKNILYEKITESFLERESFSNKL